MADDQQRATQKPGCVRERQPQDEPRAKNLTPGGTIEAITGHSSKPIIRRHPGCVPVDIIEITLPGK